MTVDDLRRALADLQGNMMIIVRSVDRKRSTAGLDIPSGITVQNRPVGIVRTGEPVMRAVVIEVKKS